MLANPYAFETPEQQRERKRREAFERAKGAMPGSFEDVTYVPQSQIDAQARREDQQRKARLAGPDMFYGSPQIPAVAGAQAALRDQLAPSQPVNFTQGGPQQSAGMFKREAIPEKQTQASGVLDFVETYAPSGVGLATTALDLAVPGLGSALAGPAARATQTAIQAGRGKTEKAKESLKKGAVKTAVGVGAKAISDAVPKEDVDKAEEVTGEAVDAVESDVTSPGPSTVDAAADAKKVLAERAREDAMRKLKQDSLSLTGRGRAELLNELTAEEARQERNYRRAITLAQSPELLDRMIESGGIGEETRANLAALGQAGLEEYDLFELGDPTSAGMRDSVKPLRGGFGKGAVSPLTGTLDYADPETRRRLQRMAALGAPREQAYVQMVDDMAPSQYVAPERAGIPEELVADAISPGRIDPGSVFVPTAATPVSMDAAMARQALVEDPNMVSAAGTQADRILSAFDELPELDLAESVDRAVAAVEANPQAQYAFQSPMSAPMAGVAPPQSQPMFEIGEQQLAEMGQSGIRIPERGLGYNMPQVPIQTFNQDSPVDSEPLRFVDMALPGSPSGPVAGASPMSPEDQQLLDRIASQNTQLRGPGQFSAFGGQQDMIDLPMESVGASQLLVNQNPVMARDLGAAGRAYGNDYQRMLAASNAPSRRPAEVELPESRFGIQSGAPAMSPAVVRGQVTTPPVTPVDIRPNLQMMAPPRPPLPPGFYVDSNGFVRNERNEIVSM